MIVNQAFDHLVEVLKSLLEDPTLKVISPEGMCHL